MTEKLIVEKTEHIATIIINNPSANTWDLESLSGLEKIISEQRFKDIFNSKRYDEVMDYIVGPKFDARYMMGSLPIQHYVNAALWKHLHGTEKIINAEGTKEPLHVNFL